MLDEKLIPNNESLPGFSQSPITQTNWKQSAYLKTIAFWSNGLFFSAHLVLNGKFLTSLGSDGAAASAIMSTYQSVVLGTGVGFLLGTGLDFGNAVGKKEYVFAGDVAKSATILSALLGSVSALFMFSTKLVFPYMFQSETAQIASDFFMGYAVASIPLLFLIVAPQVAFQENEWYVPPLTMFSVLVLSGTSSYLLGFRANMGAIGIGLGGTIGSFLTTVMIMRLSLQSKYDKYLFFNNQIDQFKTKLNNLIFSGWKLALQRLTEWGNLLIITILIGTRSNSDLKALNPSMLYLVLFGTAQQGFAQAAGMVISKNKGEITKAINDNNYTSVEINHINNIRTVFHCNLIGLLVNGTLALSFYLAQDSLARYFVSEESDDTLDLSKFLLWVNMLGLIPDGLRIISGGALRGWKDLLYPTVVSFLSMTVVGIPVGYGIGAIDKSETKIIFYIRNITMLFAGIIILNRCRHNIRKDEHDELNKYISPISIFDACITTKSNLSHSNTNQI